MTEAYDTDASHFPQRVLQLSRPHGNSIPRDHIMPEADVMAPVGGFNVFEKDAPHC